MIRPSCFASALLSCLVLACGGQSKSDAKSDTGHGDLTGTGTGGTGGTGGTDVTTTGSGTRRVCKALPRGSVATNPASCTEFEPYAYTDCSEPGLVCAYDLCVFPDYQGYSEATCTDAGIWMRTVNQGCNTPTCPALPPVIGAGCDEALTPGPCNLLNACEDPLPVYCRAGVWETDCSELEQPSDVAPALTCPGFPPTLGTPCCPRWFGVQCDFSEFLEGRNDASVGAATGINVTGAPWVPIEPIAECVRCNTSSWVWEASDDCE